jgi:DNA (cytosine-5)-methyltransferase 1
MKTIKLATVFSGIGAIEQAMIRLSIKDKIVLACDNGDIEVNIDPKERLKAIKKIKNPKEKRDYANAPYENSRRHNFVKDSYLANYEIDKENFYYDVRLIDGKVLRNKVDFFVGGSPCQSFSIAGAKGGFKDTRGTLFYDYMRLIREIRPAVFIYENVFGVLKHDGGKTWQIMQNVFHESGYYYMPLILNAKDYGIPQSRRRLIVVGFKYKKFYNKFKAPEKIKLQYSMQDFLLDNVKFGNFTSENGVLNLIQGGETPSEKLFLSDKLIKYVMSPGTKNFYHEDAKINLPIARAVLSTQANSHRASVNNYVTTNGRIRALDPRESLRLMGFPDTFKCVVSKSQMYKQSGNSIVVDVLMAVVKEIEKTGVWKYGKKVKSKSN